MAQFPAGVTTGTTLRTTLINDFNIIRPNAYPKLIRKYGMQNYTMIQQGLGNMKLATDNKMFFHYEDRSKNHFSVTAVSAVTVAAGTPVTITIGASDIYDGKSAIRLNEQVQNLYTGVYSTITAINTSVPGAYTATLTPLRALDNASVSVGDTLGFRGILDIGEQSGLQATQEKLYNKIVNYTTEIRDDYIISDLALKEKIDFVDPKTGQSYIKYIAVDNLTQRFVNYVDWKLMFAPQGDATQLSNGATGSEGVIPRIQRDGGSLSYGTFNTVNTLAQITRYLDAEGGANEYDWLYDTDQGIDIQNGIGTEFQNGAILYDQSGADQINIRRNFQSLSLFNRKVNFNKYAGFNQSTVYGVANEGTYYQNFGIMIPQDSMIDAKTSESIPSFCVRTFGGPDGGDGEIKTTYAGMFAPSNQTPTANLTVSMITYKGVQVFGAQRYLIVQK